MSGLYVHIPFCNEKCHYCDFYSGNQLYLIEDYVNAIVHEIALRESYLSDKEINTIYFGGGTPSLLSFVQIFKILEEIRLRFTVKSDAEITLECNPENINFDYLVRVASVGINRISLGVQFLDDEVLRKFNRQHSKSLILNSLNVLGSSSIQNVSVDLIYSVPTISDKSLVSSLELLLTYDIKHFSAYSLTISKNSKLFWKIRSGEVVENDENDFVRQYWLINNALITAGYIQYEVSNYAKDSFVSRHNLAYWNQIPYLGVGVSAHSYNLHSRQWNSLNIKKYIRNLEKGIIDVDIETLSDIDKYNEYVILKLRTFHGISNNYVKISFDSKIYSHFCESINRMKGLGHFDFIGDMIFSKNSDLLLADYLAKNLMF
ncbi:MAG: radical SAM family heme chaperone HemW [Bacteroidia bacterium]|nr:radical SAM family heme chaperone HemW [Bacteroidia bacterium]